MKHTQETKQLSFIETLILLFGLAAIVATLSGCASATLAPDQCRGADWQMIGRIDGREGRALTYRSLHDQSCEASGARVDGSNYERGWAVGNAEYCTPEAGYDAGVQGRVYLGVCTGEAEIRFTEKFRLGVKVNELKAEVRAKEASISETQKYYNEDKSVVADVSRAFHLLTFSSPTADLELQKSNINSELRKEQELAPVTSSHLAAHELESRRLVPYAGAAVGTAMGFGLGHAIQGRYRSDGWKWTAAETGVLVGLIGATSQCPKYDRGIPGRRCSNSALPAALMAGLIGLRLWEIFDVWSYASQAGNEYKNVTLPPPPPAGGFAVGFRESEPVLTYVSQF